MPLFIPGLELSGFFYQEVVAPILARRFPDLPYAAVLNGPGSEGQGFDTERSTDHNWGPRLLLLLRDEDEAQYKPEIVEVMRHELPYEFRGYPTNFTPSDDEDTLLLRHIDSGPVNHKIDVATVRRILWHALRVETVDDLQPRDWLLFPQQRLRELTGGAVYHDGVGEVTAMREALRWYPRDVWLYMLAAQWMRISQEEPFIGRTGEVGDDLGSAIVTARVARDIMRLCFLMERHYAPYSKWLGAAFARLRCSPELVPVLSAATRAGSWQERESALLPAYRMLGRMHNELGTTEPLSEEPRQFHDRPFLVSAGERFAHALHEKIEDERVRALPPWIGGVDQFVDSVDVLSYPDAVRRLASMWRAL